jgi:Protein of unknown function (DUF3574)
MPNQISLVAAAIVALVVGALVVQRLQPAELNATACRSDAKTMSQLELLFGASRKGGGEVTDAEWTSFLDTEVTPRFPDGLTVLTGSGQWRTDSGVLTKERSRMLIVWYQPASDSDTKIEAIRSVYKARFKQDSVMRVDGASCVSF